MEISIGSVSATPVEDRQERFTAILWGPAKSGKTTLASTAPKPILYLMFDPDGAASLKRDEGVYIADFSGAKDNIVEKFKTSNSQELRDIEKYLAEGVATLVLDSMTAFGSKALKHGITMTPKATLEEPGWGGYGKKSVYVTNCIENLIAVTQRQSKNFIAIGHEDAPQKSESGAITKQTILLGSSLVVTVPKDVSEVWYIHDTNGRHEVLVRPRFPLGPMGTRMFDARQAGAFQWRYDPVECKGEGIALWLERWKENNYNKIPLPR